MEVTQIARRIVIQHWRVIALCVLVAVGGVLVFERGHATTYTADARLVLDTEDPTTRQEAAAIADTAKAIATSPGQVRSALSKAGATGLDPRKVADTEVSVTSLGSSGLLQLSVRDESPARAAAIANALANGVIDTRLASTRGSSRALLADLAARQAELRRRIGRADAQLSQLNARAVNPTSAAAARRDAAERQRQSLSTQAGMLESERISLLTDSAGKPRPAVVSAATPPAHADPSDLPVHIVLGVLLGLIVGVALAAALEVVRPTVVGSDAVAREFGAPLLGTLPASPERKGLLGDLSRLKGRLVLALGMSRIASVSLVAAGPDVDLRPLAARLDGGAPQRLGAPVLAGATPDTQATAAPPSAPGALRVHAGWTGGVPSTNGHPVAGVVVVAPSSMPMSEVTETAELLRVSATPVVGVITYDRPHPARDNGGDA